MNIYRKTKTSLITEGAIYSAAYALMAILTRYLISGTDSFIYYLYPIPLAIYTVRASYKYGFVVLMASLLLSFLFGNPLFVALMILPNLIIGYLFGVLEHKSHLKILNVFILFILCLIADFLSIYAFEVITGIGYFDDVTKLAIEIFNFFGVGNLELVSKVVLIASVSVLLIDSFIKVLFIYIIFALIVMRLKLIKDYTFKMKIPVIYTPIHALIYIFILILNYILIISLLYVSSNILNVSIMIVMSMLFVYSFYFIYQFIFYFKLKTLHKKVGMGMNIFVVLFSMLLFPFTIIYSLILNFIKWK